MFIWRTLWVSIGVRFDLPFQGVGELWWLYPLQVYMQLQRWCSQFGEDWCYYMISHLMLKKGSDVSNCSFSRWCKSPILLGHYFVYICFQLYTNCSFRYRMASSCWDDSCTLYIYVEDAIRRMCALKRERDVEEEKELVWLLEFLWAWGRKWEKSLISNKSSRKCHCSLIEWVVRSKLQFCYRIL